MPVAAADQPLFEIVSAAAPATIEDVIATMRKIDSLLADRDGLKWFNRLYLMVTEQVDLRPPASGWKDPAWLMRLDVVFAGFYFKAVSDFLNGSTATASSWDALLEARYLSGIDRIQ
jgi:hypothetical protein